MKDASAHDFAEKSSMHRKVTEAEPLPTMHGDVDEIAFDKNVHEVLEQPGDSWNHQSKQGNSFDYRSSVREVTPNIDPKLSQTLKQKPLQITSSNFEAAPSRNKGLAKNMHKSSIVNGKTSPMSKVKQEIAWKNDGQERDLKIDDIKQKAVRPANAKPFSNSNLMSSEYTKLQHSFNFSKQDPSPSSYHKAADQTLGKPHLFDAAQVFGTIHPRTIKPPEADRNEKKSPLNLRVTVFKNKIKRPRVVAAEIGGVRLKPTLKEKSTKHLTRKRGVGSLIVSSGGQNLEEPADSPQLERVTSRS
mmetsp:Transcript_16645/g.25662  ORF Transcript_16645/g.25662 Transcript_16645/m.25662 type:complete len:302 (-) Transcript_16645:743-1648(-)